MRHRHQGEGAAAPIAPPSLKTETEVLIYVATELPNGKVRYGYQIKLDGKVVAEPKQTFRSHNEVYRNADAVMEQLLNMFGEIVIRKHDQSTPKLSVVHGGLLDEQLHRPLRISQHSRRSAMATRPRITEERHELRLAA